MHVFQICFKAQHDKRAFQCFGSLFLSLIPFYWFLLQLYTFSLVLFDEKWFWNYRSEMERFFVCSIPGPNKIVRQLLPNAVVWGSLLPSSILAHVGSEIMSLGAVVTLVVFLSPIL